MLLCAYCRDAIFVDEHEFRKLPFKRAVRSRDESNAKMYFCCVECKIEYEKYVEII